MSPITALFTKLFTATSLSTPQHSITEGLFYHRSDFTPFFGFVDVSPPSAMYFASAMCLLSRKVFQQLLEAVALGKVDIVIVHTLDRWARNLKVLLVVQHH